MFFIYFQFELTGIVSNEFFKMKTSLLQFDILLLLSSFLAEIFSMKGGYSCEIFIWRLTWSSD